MSTPVEVITDQRAFLLTLDKENGQQLAAKAGFVPPSQEVADRETIDVYKEWGLADLNGIIPRLALYAKTYVDVTAPPFVTGQQRLSMASSMTIMMIAAVSRLRQNGLIDYQTDEDNVMIVASNADGQVYDFSIPEELMYLAAEMEEHLASEGEEHE